MSIIGHAGPPDRSAYIDPFLRASVASVLGDQIGGVETSPLELSEQRRVGPAMRPSLRCGRHGEQRRLPSA